MGVACCVIGHIQAGMLELGRIFEDLVGGLEVAAGRVCTRRSYVQPARERKERRVSKSMNGMRARLSEGGPRKNARGLLLQNARVRGERAGETCDI
jgi:hypothetical protein